eukprot:GHVH01004867.1.p1 GENE.GHVH01004867.1~~GHVH01004867.1.p1  ORF type:complete len:579 (+),score=63.25 GHVH01004867.1:35-1771(+)
MSHRPRTSRCRGLDDLSYTTEETKFKSNQVERSADGTFLPTAPTSIVRARHPFARRMRGRLSGNLFAIDTSGSLPHFPLTKTEPEMILQPNHYDCSSNSSFSSYSGESSSSDADGGYLGRSPGVQFYQFCNTAARVASRRFSRRDTTTTTMQKEITASTSLDTVPNSRRSRLYRRTSTANSTHEALNVRKLRNRSQKMDEDKWQVVGARGWRLSDESSNEKDKNNLKTGQISDRVFETTPRKSISIIDPSTVSHKLKTLPLSEPSNSKELTVLNRTPSGRIAKASFLRRAMTRGHTGIKDEHSQSGGQNNLSVVGHQRRPERLSQIATMSGHRALKQRQLAESLTSGHCLENEEDLIEFLSAMRRFAYGKPIESPSVTRTKVYLEVSFGIDQPSKDEQSNINFHSSESGRVSDHKSKVIIQLFNDIVPNASENFIQLCTGEATHPKTRMPMSYKGTKFFRCLPGFMIQGGDITDDNGKGGHSAMRKKHFEDENFRVLQRQAGLVCYANVGVPNTNNSQFYITLAPTPWLDGLNVCFGRVVHGHVVLDRIEKLSDHKGQIGDTVTITDCGNFSDKMGLR